MVVTASAAAATADQAALVRMSLATASAAEAFPGDSSVVSASTHELLPGIASSLVDPVVDAYSRPSQELQYLS